MMRITSEDPGKVVGIIPCLLLVLCLSVVVVSCGQKGALYIPQTSISETLDNESRQDDTSIVEVPEA